MILKPLRDSDVTRKIEDLGTKLVGSYQKDAVDLYHGDFDIAAPLA